MADTPTDKDARVVGRATSLLRSLMDPFRSAPGEQRAPAAVAAQPVDVDAGQAEQAPVHTDDVDPELRQVFIAEAQACLEEIDHQLDALAVDASQTQAVSELQRALHTLKGSAGVAGASAMANACHQLETRLAQMPPADAKSLRPDVDLLHRLHEQLQIGVQANPSAGQQASSRTPVVALATTQGLVEPASLFAADGGEASTFAARLFVDADASVEAMPRSPEADTVRLTLTTLNELLDAAGEVDIFRTRLEQHNSNLQAQLDEMTRTTQRLRSQIVELQMQAGKPAAALSPPLTTPAVQKTVPAATAGGFVLQELSERVTESLEDLTGLQQSMATGVRHDETLLVQQSRVNADVQKNLIDSLMVPFSLLQQRLQRVVEQTCSESGRVAELVVAGADVQLDRNVLEHMAAPLEHLLRNAVIHGIGDLQQRQAAGKSQMGRIEIQVCRHGAQFGIEVSDDGRGLDLAAIRQQAIVQGVLEPDEAVADAQLAQLILEPGFSTAKSLTQSAGRGVGLDVVQARIRQLGGRLHVSSHPGDGTCFAISLPMALTITQAMLVRVAAEKYAIPLNSIAAVLRVPAARLAASGSGEQASIEHQGTTYQVQQLDVLLGCQPQARAQAKVDATSTVLLSDCGTRHMAFAVDDTLGRRELLVKQGGALMATVPAVRGATVMADGSVVLVLDLAGVCERQAQTQADGACIAPQEESSGPRDERPLVMIVDDSITVRRASENFLTDHGYRVASAKDGLDARAQLRDIRPQAMILDIDMPGMNGFELATHMRSDARLRSTPIIMMTARSSEKYRRRAHQAGVDCYMTKPCQNAALLDQLCLLMAGTAAVLDNG